MHGARVVHRVAERRLAQRTRQGREVERRRRLVIPHVRAVAMAASARIVGALEAVKLTIRRPETRGGDQRRKIRARRFFDGSRQRALAQRRREQACFLLEARKIRGRILRRVPRTLEAARNSGRRSPCAHRHSVHASQFGVGRPDRKRHASTYVNSTPTSPAGIAQQQAHSRRRIQLRAASGPTLHARRPRSSSRNSSGAFHQRLCAQLLPAT